MQAVNELKSYFNRRRQELPNEYGIRMTKLIVRISCVALTVLATATVVIYMNSDLPHIILNLTDYTSFSLTLRTIMIFNHLRVAFALIGLSYLFMENRHFD